MTKVIARALRLAASLSLSASLNQIRHLSFWTPTGSVDTTSSGTMVYEERTGSGTGAQEVHPGI